MTKKILTKVSKNESLINKEITAIIVTILILLLTALIVGFAFLEYSRAHYKDKSAPSQFFENVNFSGLTSSQAQKLLRNTLNLHLKKEVEFNHNQESVTLSYNEIGASANFNPNFRQIKFYSGKPTRLELLFDQFKPKQYKARLSLSSADLEQNLVDAFPALSPPQSAGFTWNQLALEISPELIGNDTNFNQLRVDILTGKTNLDIPVKVKYPTVVSSDLEPMQEAFAELASSPLKLSYSNNSFDYSFGQNPEVVVFNKDSEGLIVPSIDTDSFSSFIQSELEPNIAIKPEVLEINYENGRAKFSGIGKSGKMIDQESLFQEVNEYLTSTLLEQDFSLIGKSISIKTSEKPPTLVIAPELQSRGIQELVSYGYTTFHGSPHNRIHNINVGTNNYNGIIIPQGQVFSFNDNLGPINADAGYKPELVIKGDQTIPEYGGGICQVSTTVYRGALFGGFEITERHNHSYTVSYYAQELGHGLDATIYRGSKDLQFKNDTPGDLVMQIFTEGTTMTVRFFGTSDNRKVELVGPRVLSQTPAGAPIYEVNPELPLGTVKQVDSPIAGLSTEWTRKITRPNGIVDEELITSRFRAVPPKFVVSTDHYSY